VAAAGLAIGGCQREFRGFNPPPETGPRVVELSDLRPDGEAPPPPDPRDKEDEGNAFHISNSQRYFAWFNCSGRHFNGGGGIGPALMDEKWRLCGAHGVAMAPVRSVRGLVTHLKPTWQVEVSIDSA
jgi:hypothetical protein